MFHRWVGALVGLAMMGMAGTAHATLITQQIDFTASGFPASAPTDPVIGSVTLTFDPMGGDITDQTTNIALNTLNISILGSVIAFSYLAANDILFVGGDLNGAGSLKNSTDDFRLVFRGIRGDSPLLFLELIYSASTSEFFKTESGTIGVQKVSEPPALALFAIGLAMLVFLRLRRRWSLAFRDSVAWIVGSYPCAPNRRSPNRPNA